MMGSTISRPDWPTVYFRLKMRIEAAGVDVRCQSLGPQTTGVFDGTSITTNTECDFETRCHNMAHAFGHIVQWSLDGPRFQSLYDELYVSKDRKEVDPDRLEHSLCVFREYEEEASAYAAGLLIETGNRATLPAFTLFARADIEAIISYHRDGHAPVWQEFFSAWRNRIVQGGIQAPEFVPKAIPQFTPKQIAAQEVVRGVQC
jgi:hypothetical protein